MLKEPLDAVKLNIDEASEIARRYRVQSIPTLKSFRGGAVAGELTGMQSEASLVELFDGVTPRKSDQLVADADAAGDAAQRERLRAQIHLGAAGRDHAERNRLAEAADAGDTHAALELGRALAADGEHDAAVERLLAAVADPGTRESARQALLEVFAVLGDDHELTQRARPRLARALY